MYHRLAVYFLLLEIAYKSARWGVVAGNEPRRPGFHVARGGLWLVAIVRLWSLGGTRARSRVQPRHVFTEIPGHLLTHAVARGNLTQGRIGLSGGARGVLLSSRVRGLSVGFGGEGRSVPNEARRCSDDVLGTDIIPGAPKCVGSARRGNSTATTGIEAVCGRRGRGFTAAESSGANIAADSGARAGGWIFGSLGLDVGLNWGAE